MQFDRLKRRDFITLLGGAAVWPLRAHGQGERIRRVGVLIGIADDAEGQACLAAFRNGCKSWAGPKAAASGSKMEGRSDAFSTGRPLLFPR